MMSLQEPPSGTRGARTPPRLLGKMVIPVMTWIHRRSGDRFQGMDLLYLTTVGARSGAVAVSAMGVRFSGLGAARPCCLTPGKSA